MQYAEIQPCEALAPFINCYWYYHADGQRELTDCSFPDGSVEIVFNIRTKVYRSADGQTYSRNPSTELIGQFASRYHVHCVGENRFLGVRFFPHTFSLFCALPLHETLGLSLDAAETLGKGFSRLAEVIQHHENPLSCIGLLEEYFLKRLHDKSPDRKTEILKHAVPDMIRASGEFNLDQLLQKTKTNARYIQRLFLERVGVSPRFLIKVLRFQQSFRYLHAGNNKLTDVAYACGYFDQAHFINNFKEFTGTTPSQYLSTVYPINRNFLNAENSAYLFNLG